MKPRLVALVTCCLTLSCAIALKARDGAPASPTASAPDLQAPLCGGEPCDAVVRGALAFVDRRLHGLGANGRSCADCHMPTDRFQLSPASAEAARFRWAMMARRPPASRCFSAASTFGPMLPRAKCPAR